GAVTLLTTSRVTGRPRGSVTVSENTIESPVIFTTTPFWTVSRSCRLYCFFAAFSTIAIQPLCVFTTPLRTTCEITTQRAPVVHAGFDRMRSSDKRIGLMNGSRRFAFATSGIAGFTGAGFCAVVVVLTGVFAAGFGAGAFVTRFAVAWVFAGAGVDFAGAAF